MPAAGNDNTNVNRNNIIFTMKGTKLYVLVVTLSARDNQNLSKILSKGFERSVYWDEYQRTNENKNTTNQYRYFLKSNFAGVNRLFVLIYLNRNNDVKRFNARKYHLPKGIIDNNRFIVNGENFYDQSIDSDIKQYKELRKQDKLKVTLLDV